MKFGIRNSELRRICCANLHLLKLLKGVADWCNAFLVLSKPSVYKPDMRLEGAVGIARSSGAEAGNGLVRFDLSCDLYAAELAYEFEVFIIVGCFHLLNLLCFYHYTASFFFSCTCMGATSNIFNSITKLLLGKADTHDCGLLLAYRPCTVLLRLNRIL